MSSENASVEVLTSTGAAVEGVAAATIGADGATVTAAVPDLAIGVYTVRFHVVSAVDGHATEGAFAFQVDPSGTQPPLIGTPTTTTGGGDPLTTAARWLGLCGALALFGIALFWLVAGRPALDLVESRRERRGVWRAMAASSLTALSGLAVFLTLSSRGLSTVEPDSGHAHFALDFAGPFGMTLFANAMRVVEVATLLAFFLSLTRATASERPRSTPAFSAAPGGGAVAASVPLVTAERRGEVLALLVIMALAAAALAGYSVAGHASALGGPLLALVDWGHLLAVATWIGPLPGLLLFFVVYAPRQHGTEARSVALRAAVMRHSAVALLAAPTVALTGIASSSLLVGPSRNLVASDYGNIVVAKILLFSLAAAIGAVNFFLLRRGDLRRMLVTVAAELAIGVVAVVAAAALGGTPPAASRPDRVVTPPAESAVLDERSGDVTVQLVVTAPAPGRQLYQASVLDGGGREYRSDVAKVFLVFNPPPESGLGAQRVEAQGSVTQPGVFRLSGTYTPVVGDWTVDVIVRRAGLPDESVSMDLPVREPVPAERLTAADSGIGVPAPLRAAWGLLPVRPFEWVPAAVLLAVAAGLFLAVFVGRKRLGPGLTTFLERARLAVVALAVVAALVAGSRMLVNLIGTPPVEAASISNPEPASGESIERGARAYSATCQSCHADPAGVATESRTDGELYYLITNGVAGTSMPPFATELGPRDRWDIVNYLRSE